jgi:hypothetical protein
MSQTAAIFEDGAVYQAKVIDQMVTRNRDDDLVVIITVALVGKLRNPKNPSDGTEDCPRAEKEVWVAFVDDDENRLRMAVRDMERLGFTDDDVSRLHPEHPQSFRLLDKEVLVRCRILDGNEYWNFAWPREKPAPVEVTELQGRAASLKEKIAAAKKGKGLGRKKSSPTNSPATRIEQGPIAPETGGRKP